MGAHHQALEHQGITLRGRRLTDNILFASEMVGAVRGIDPGTSHYYDDTKRYVDAIDWVSAADNEKIFQGNARKVYGRFAKRGA